MKKILLLILIVTGVCCATDARQHKKIKKTSTIGQKIHNTFSKHKKYNGYKVKSERNGVERKHKVNRKTGVVKDKSHKEK